MDISAISSLSTGSVQGLSQNVKTTSGTESLGKTFGDVLTSLNDSQQKADDLITQLSNGENVEIADVMIATTENDVNFRVAMAIRDKLVDAYREVMRMSV